MRMKLIIDGKDIVLLCRCMCYPEHTRHIVLADALCDSALHGGLICEETVTDPFGESSTCRGCLTVERVEIALDTRYEGPSTKIG